MKTNKEIMETTTDRYVYNRTRKNYLEHSGNIRCNRCPYHKYENCTRKVRRNWKAKRKTKWKE